MNTVHLLLAVYETTAIPLERICVDLFGVNYDQARRLAALNELPVPTYRARDSERAPLLVDVVELATYLEQRAECAKRQWLHSQV